MFQGKKMPFSRQGAVRDWVILGEHFADLKNKEKIMGNWSSSVL